MECSNAQSLIDGYLDHELDPARSLEVEAHLRVCSVCTRSYQDRQALRDALKVDALYCNAPAGLENRVQRALRQAAKGEVAPGRRAWSWMKVAAPLAAAALVVLTLLPFFGGRSGRSGDELLTEEVVASHIRSLQADHLADVASSDRHTVKPWFTGKLDFSPPVEDLAAAGFPLLGGRLDYLNNRAVAALVYRRDKHLINVFVWPSSESGNTPMVAALRHGYNLLHWTDSGLSFWVVSDLERDQLEKLVEFLKASRARAYLLQKPDGSAMAQMEIKNASR